MTVQTVGNQAQQNMQLAWPPQHQPWNSNVRENMLAGSAKHADLHQHLKFTFVLHSSVRKNKCPELLQTSREVPFHLNLGEAVLSRSAQNSRMDTHKNYYCCTKDVETVFVIDHTDQAWFLQKYVLWLQLPPYPSSTATLIPYHHSCPINNPTEQEVNVTCMSPRYHQMTWNKDNLVTSTQINPPHWRGSLYHSATHFHKFDEHLSGLLFHLFWS